MNKYIICFPFGYTYISRIKTISKFISFLLTIPLPTFVMFYYGLLSLENRNIYTGLLFLWVYINMYIFYENGYIENDIKTVKKEINPTRRIVGDLYKFIDINYQKILSVRVILFITSTLFLLFFKDYKIASKLVFFSASISIIYYFHNNIRSGFKVVTFFCLSSARFIFPLAIFSDLIMPGYETYILLSMFIYTIPAFIIYSAKSFKLTKFLVGIENKFKILYYSLIFCCFILLWMFSNDNHIYSVMMFVSLYMLLLISLKKILNK